MALNFEAWETLTRTNPIVDVSDIMAGYNSGAEEGILRVLQTVYWVAGCEDDENDADSSLTAALFTVKMLDFLSHHPANLGAEMAAGADQCLCGVEHNPGGSLPQRV